MKIPGSSSIVSLTLVPEQTFNDPKLLPGPMNSSISLSDGPERRKLHSQHPAMVRRKLRERPYSEPHKPHESNKDVYCSISENYCPRNWDRIGTSEPLLPVRKLCL